MLEIATINTVFSKRLTTYQSPRLTKGDFLMQKIDNGTAIFALVNIFSASTPIDCFIENIRGKKYNAGETVFNDRLQSGSRKEFNIH